MLNRRIGPDGAFLKEFVNIRDRLKALETKPSGNIVIREQLTTTDPVTGVGTVFGQLPDGSTGIQPFVGDIVPPPVATAPVASAQAGTVTIAWDGNFVASAEQPRDFEHLNVMAHKIVSGSTVFTVQAGVIRLSSESLIITTEVVTAGETWEFSFESEDYNGNRSARSARSNTVTILSVADDADVAAAIADLTTAIEDVQTSADGKNKIIYSASDASGTGYTEGDTWFKKSGTVVVAQWEFTSGAWASRKIDGQTLANLDAGTITFGSMSGSRIDAKSIRTDRLLITSTDNLILEADFSNSGASWGLGANNSINSAAGRASLPAMRFTGTVSTITSLNLNNKISVNSENRFRGSMWVKSSSVMASGKIFLKAKAYTASSTFTEITVATNTAMTSGTWTNIGGIAPVLATNVIALEFFVEVTNPTTGTTTDIDFVGVTRAADGHLVIDGAMDAKTITGAYIKTATSGARWEMDASGLRGYGTIGQYFLADSTGLSIVGSITSEGGGYQGGTGTTLKTFMGKAGVYDASGIHFLDDTDPLGTNESPAGLVAYGSTGRAVGIKSRNNGDGYDARVTVGPSADGYDGQVNITANSSIGNAKVVITTPTLVVNGYTLEKLACTFANGFANHTSGQPLTTSMVAAGRVALTGMTTMPSNTVDIVIGYVAAAHHPVTKVFLPISVNHAGTQYSAGIATVETDGTIRIRVDTGTVGTGGYIAFTGFWNII